ncbi:MAG: glycosyl hydrolase family 18 protein [bacterium]
MLKIKVFVFILILLIIAIAMSLIIRGKRSKEIYNPVISYETSNNPFRFIEEIFNKNSSIKKPSKTVFGFLPYWSLGEEEHLDYSVLTDIAYFALYVNGKGEFITRTEDGTTEPGYLAWKEGNTIKTVIKKAKENKVRVALTIAAHDNGDIENLLNCNSCWYTLSTNIENELEEKGIWDINLDFEYTGVPPHLLDARYTNLVAFLKNELTIRNVNAKVTVSTFADSLQRIRVTNIAQLTNVADELFIMAYDFYQPTSDKAGPVAPLGGYPNKYDYDLTQMLEDYKKVSDPNKLILGVPYYGYNWVVEDESPNSTRIPGSDVLGFSISQNYAQIESSGNRTTDKWDEEAKVPYFTYYSDETGSIRQVYYENADSLREKYKFAKSENLAGVGIWALGYDEDKKELWEVLREEFLPK